MTEHICKECGRSFDSEEDGWTVDGDYYYCPECSEEQEDEEVDESTDDSEHRLMDGGPALIIREEPEQDHHTVMVTLSPEEEPVERISPVEETETEIVEETEETEETEEEPKKEESEQKEPKKSRFAIPIPSGRTLPRRNGKSPKKKKDEDKEYDVDSFHERYRRWRLIHKEGYVVLKTLYREPQGEYMLESTLVKFEDLPRGAVAVTNEKNTYCLDQIKTSEWYLTTHIDPHEDYYESQFTASDAALYMNSNKIDNALAIKWTEMSHVDFKKYIWVAVAGLAVILFMIMRMRG